MSKRKAPEGRRERMAFYNTLSDRELAKLPDSELQFLSAAAVLRLPSERQRAYEQATASQFAEIRARNQEHQQALELVVAALCDGDVDYHRLEIELYRATGISVDRLLELWVGDFWAYARAEANRRDPRVKAKAADWQENTTKGWAAWFGVTPHSITDWASEGKGWIEKVKHGRYRVNLKSPEAITRRAEAEGKRTKK